MKSTFVTILIDDDLIQIRQRTQNKHILDLRRIIRISIEVRITTIPYRGKARVRRRITAIVIGVNSAE